MGRVKLYALVENVFFIWRVFKYMVLVNNR